MSCPPLVRMIAAALWLLIASGPVLGGLALLQTGPEEAAAARTGPPAEVMAFAELAVLAHLTGIDDVAARVAPTTRVLLGGGDDAAPGPGSSHPQLVRVPGPQAVAAIGARPAGPARWGVEVLVLDRDGSVETWQATIGRTEEGPALEAAPVLVPTAPQPAGPPVGIGSLRDPDPEDPLAATVQGFVAAMLLGEGDLQRYVAASFQGGAIPGGVQAAAVRRIGVMRTGPASAAALAEVAADREDGRQHRMHLPLLLTHDGSRWQVDRILPALPLAPRPG